MKIVVFGLSLSSSWGNGHATTYRALLRATAARGHSITFYEWNAPWYSAHRDLPDPDFLELQIYDSWEQTAPHAVAEALEADATIVGSCVDRGIEIIDTLAAAGVRPLCFYDIDTPVTIAALREGTSSYIRPDQVPLFDRYLSFTGGPFLQRVVEAELGARAAVPLYCSVDPERYRMISPAEEFTADLAYMGTYAPDRQPIVDRMLVSVARRLPRHRFIVAGPMYTRDITWPDNVGLIEHVPPGRHAAFYSSARWQLNATRSAMTGAGWSPSVRLFEAGAVGAAVMSDRWPGIDELFVPGEELLLPGSTDEVIEILTSVTDERRREIGTALRGRVLSEHTAARRAAELEGYLLAARRSANGGDVGHHQGPGWSEKQSKITNPGDD